MKSRHPTSPRSPNRSKAERSGPDERELLELWEAGADLHPLDRALALIEIAEGIGCVESAGLPVGLRDRHLFGIAARLFGARIAVLAECAGCGRDVEIWFEAEHATALETDVTEIEVAHAGRALTVRRPTSADLARALRSDAPRERLLSTLAGLDAAEPALLDAVESALADAAGLSDLTLRFDCADCGAAGETVFDILDYLWRRIAADALRLIADIHTLAASYGWTSDEILSLSRARREAHIAMVTG